MPNKMNLGLAFLLIFLCAGATKESLNELVASADAILNRDNVGARNDIGIVFQAANRLAAAGRFEEAGRYYQSGLTIEPRDFDNHLRYARVLLKQERREDANRQLQIVLNSAENPVLTTAARALLGMSPPQITPLSELHSRGPVLVLIPLGDVDLLLLQQEQSRLHEELGIDVQIRSVNWMMPLPARSIQAAMEAGIADELRRSWQRLRTSNPQEFSAVMQRYGVTEADMNEDRKLFQVSVKFLRDGGDTRQAQAIEEILTAMDGQWDADTLVNSLAAAV